MDNVTLRLATTADLDEINRIYNDEILHGVATWDGEPWSAIQRAEWLQEHDALTPVLVAQKEGAFAGFAYLSYCYKRSGWRFTRESTIYIDPRFQGQGLGDLLLGDLLRRAQEIGVNHVLACIESNNTASLRLHTKHGFTVIGRQEEAGFKFGRWLDQILMQRLLRNG